MTIHRSAKENGVTLVGNDNFLMNGVHCAHDTRVGNATIIVNNTLLAGYVQIDDRAFLGGATLVHQHVRIGSLAITRGGTRLTKDVPPYFMAVAINQVSGINRLGLRRAGFSQETRRTIQAAYELIYRANLNISRRWPNFARSFTSRKSSPSSILSPPASAASAASAGCGTMMRNRLPRRALY